MMLFPFLVDGNYTDWGEFSRCSVSCGNGSQIRQRTCTNPRPAHGGKNCLEQKLGDDTEERFCNNGPCARELIFPILYIKLTCIGNDLERF